MDRDNKIGLVFAIVWMLFVVVLFATYLYIPSIISSTKKQVDSFP